MYVSILTGRVAKDNWVPLEHSFEKEVTKKPPKGLMDSYLVQSEDDPASWQVVSVWATKAEFKDFEKTEQANVFVELLCDSGTVPHRLGYVTVGRYERV
ncbi:MAG: antibiotic biosynthesis monooxygenase [Bellilinea sp.]